MRSPTMPVDREWMEDMARAAERVACDLEPWPDYFKSKAAELATISNLCPLGDISSLLEVGCGNGFTSVLLAARSRRVEAYDLPMANPRSHSIGIEIAEELVRRLGVKNVGVTAGRAEDLPFADGSFDVVFSEYALQYVADKPKALREMRRVLARNGRVVTVVPNFTERVFAPFLRYSCLPGRIFGLIAPDAGKARPPSAASGKLVEKRKRSLADLAGEHLPLRADGAYGSFREELLRHTPSSWKRLFADNGFKVTKTFTTQLLPLGLFGLMGRPVARFVSRHSRPIDGALGGAPVLKDFGYSLGLAAEKA